MKSSVIAVIMTVAVCAFLASCASREVAPPEGKKQAEATVEPTKSFEDCAEMTDKNVMFYSFKSSAPVDFNVHYHEGGAVTYSVQAKNTTTEEGKFYPDRKQYFCLMWTNNQNEPARLSYSYKIDKK